MVAAAAVTMGFLLMYMLENLILPHFALSHLGHAHEAATETARRVGGLSVFIALGVHTLIDGIALGVAVTGGEDFALGGLVFVALISHHMPASFSLTSALKANQYPNGTAFL
jgi:zinc and cadmium transporter